VLRCVVAAQLLRMVVYGMLVVTIVHGAEATVVTAVTAVSR
jgi:hypothetical protein